VTADTYRHVPSQKSTV